jgi:hypothetical protein
MYGKILEIQSWWIFRLYNVVVGNSRAAWRPFSSIILVGTDIGLSHTHASTNFQVKFRHKVYNFA